MDLHQIYIYDKALNSFNEQFLQHHGWPVSVLLATMEVLVSTSTSILLSACAEMGTMARPVNTVRNLYLHSKLLNRI